MSKQQFVELHFRQTPHKISPNENNQIINTKKEMLQKLENIKICSYGKNLKQLITVKGSFINQKNKKIINKNRLIDINIGILTD